MLWYGLLKLAMPQVAYDVLFKEGHIVMTLTALVAKCLHLDEAMEMCAIRHTKMLNTCIPEILEKSPAFMMLAGRLRDALERDINSSRKRYSDAEVRARANDPNHGKVKVDGEKRTAYNVRMLYELLSEADWLVFSHRGAEKLINVLRKQRDDDGIARFDPFELDNSKACEALMNANEKGRQTASLQVCAKLESIFGGLTEEDYEKHFGGKTLSSKWTFAFVIKAMKDFDDTKKDTDKGKKRKKYVHQVIKDAFYRRKSVVWNTKERLMELRESASQDLRSSKTQVLKEIAEIEHMVCEKDFAYRSALGSDEPFSRIDTKVYQKLQQVMTSVAVEERQLAMDNSSELLDNEGRQISPGLQITN